MQRDPTRLEGSATPNAVTRLAGRVATIRPNQLAIPVGIGILVFVVFGILQRTLYPEWLLANLDSEASAATPFSASLLWAGALAWVLVALVERPVPRPVLGWAGLLGLLALDEGIAFHEALERGTGIDWQVLYLPILGLGALTWQRVVGRYRASPAATLLIAGGAIWAVTLILELVQHWGGQAAQPAIYDPAMITEEALEMIGSTLVMLAGLTKLRADDLGERISTV